MPTDDELKSALRKLQSSNEANRYLSFLEYTLLAALDEVYSNAEERLGCLTRNGLQSKACEYIGVTEPGPQKALIQWWDKQTENRIKARNALRQGALLKLTAEEIQVLGIK